MSEKAKKIVKKQWIAAGVYLAVIIMLLVWYFHTLDSECLYYCPYGEFLNMLTICVIAFVLMMGVAMLIYQQQLNKITEILNEKCDPFLFEECWSSLKYLTLNKSIRNYNSAVAKYAQGNMTEAWKLLNEVNPHKMRRKQKIYYYSLLSDLLFEQGMVEQLRQPEEKYSVIIKNENERQNMRRLCAQNNMYRAYMNHDFESAYRFLEEERMNFGKMSSVVMKINAAYWTGVFDKEMGNTVAAKAHLQFVIEHGNRVFLVEKAQKILDELKGKDEIEEVIKEEKRKQ